MESSLNKSTNAGSIKQAEHKMEKNSFVEDATILWNPAPELIKRAKQNGVLNNNLRALQSSPSVITTDKTEGTS
jgi:hypothetical protein